MPSFQAKIGLKKLRKKENKNYRSVPFRSYPTHNRKLQKKLQKNKKKIKKNTIMATFKARIGWKRPRNKVNNYCRSVSFLPNA